MKYSYKVNLTHTILFKYNVFSTKHIKYSFTLFFSIFTILSCYSQQAPIKPDSNARSPLISETGIVLSTSTSATFCQQDYCIVHTDKNKGLFGIINNSGRLILNPIYSKIRVFRLSKNVYFRALKDSLWFLFDTAGKPILPPNKNRIYVLKSDETNDYFFRELELLDKPFDEFVRGNIIALNRITHLTNEYLDTFMIDIFKFHNFNSTAENYFFRGLLISPRPLGNLHIRYLNLDTFKIFNNVQMLTRYRSLAVVVKSGQRYQFKDISIPDTLVLQFDRFENDRGLHILYWENSKVGAVVFDVSDKTRFESYKIIPAIFDSISILGMSVQLTLNDTLYNTGYSEIENWRNEYFTAYKINKNGSLKRIEKEKTLENEVVNDNIKDTFSFKKLIPNGFWLGFNYNSNNYGYSNAGPNITFNDRSFEIGIGTYYYSKSDSWFPDEWQIVGFGIGYERRIPMTNKKIIDSITNGVYKQNYLNVRGELGFGFTFLNLDLSLHLQVGYASDFTHHFFRPGIGISAGRLQFGYNGLINLGNENPKILKDGFYARFIYTLNTELYDVSKTRRKSEWF